MFRRRKLTLSDGRSVVIRRAKPQDAEAIIALVNVIGAEGIHIMTERFAISLREERAFLRKTVGPSGLFIVAVLGGEIVGSADILRGRFAKNQHTASLGIGLRKEARGVGLGTAMMKTMLGWARSVGIRKITLGVFASNRHALALYRGLGFVREGCLRGQVMLRRKPVDELQLALWL